MDEDKRKHLEFIQHIITRMNANSFQIKNWAIVITAAIIALDISIEQNYFILVGIFPTIALWFLDSYYLSQERKFRGLYNDVAGLSQNPQQIRPYEMRPDLYTGGKYSMWSTFFSSTILKTYLSIIISLVLLFSVISFAMPSGSAS